MGRIYGEQDLGGTVIPGNKKNKLTGASLIVLYIPNPHITLVSNVIKLKPKVLIRHLGASITSSMALSSKKG